MQLISWDFLEGRASWVLMALSFGLFSERFEVYAPHRRENPQAAHAYPARIYPQRSGPRAGPFPSSGTRLSDTEPPFRPSDVTCGHAPPRGAQTSMKDCPTRGIMAAGRAAPNRARGRGWPARREARRRSLKCDAALQARTIGTQSPDTYHWWSPKARDTGGSGRPSP